MTDKRYKRFNREFSTVPKSELLNNIRALYVDGIIKSIPSANKLIKKIKYTKKGELYKTSIKTANIITEKFKIKKEKEGEIVINRSNLSNFEPSIHMKELYDKQKQTGDIYVEHQVKFYKKSGYSYKEIITTNQEIKGNYRKKILKEIRNKLFYGDSQATWKVKDWILPFIEKGSKDKNEGNFVIISTKSYKNNN